MMREPDTELGARQSHLIGDRGAGGHVTELLRDVTERSDDTELTEPRRERGECHRGHRGVGPPVQAERSLLRPGAEGGHRVRRAVDRRDVRPRGASRPVGDLARRARRAA